MTKVAKDAREKFGKDISFGIVVDKAEGVSVQA
jgi:hypothetical protein